MESNNMKKVILTGVTGQDGSWMADYLLTLNDIEIFGVVRRLSVPNHKNIEHILNNPRFHLVTGDLSDGQSLDNLIREIQPDYFINFAAQSFVGASWQIPEQTFDSCAVGVLRCLESIRKFAPCCRFYNAGSSEEFGDVKYAPQDMKHPLSPRSPYGAGKVAARMITKVYRESYGLYALQGLLFNHESERRGIEFLPKKISTGVAKIYHAIDNGKKFDPIEVGNIYAKRDWSHAQDFIRGIWMMMNQEIHRKIIIADELSELQKIQTLSRIIKEYILASGETRSVKEFIEAAFKCAGISGYWQGTLLDEKFISEDGDKLVVINQKFYRPAEVDLLLGDPSDAQMDLNWRREISFKDLVKRMVEYDIEAGRN